MRHLICLTVSVGLHLGLALWCDKERFLELTKCFCSAQRVSIVLSMAPVPPPEDCCHQQGTCTLLRLNTCKRPAVCAQRLGCSKFVAGCIWVCQGSLLLATSGSAEECGWLSLCNASRVHAHVDDRYRTTAPRNRTQAFNFAPFHMAVAAAIRRRGEPVPGMIETTPSKVAFVEQLVSTSSSASLPLLP